MPDALDLRLGIDVGGTNTDAVILDRAGTLLAKAKVPTTDDVTGGIVGALEAVLGVAAVQPARVTNVMLGTTHATNAVLQRRGLRKVAVIRLGSPATHAVRPLFGWPDDLRTAVSAGEAILRGGFEFDGRVIAPFEASALRAFLRSLEEPPQGVAVTGVFSPVSPSQEIEAGEVAREVLGDVDVSLSHEVGSIGLLERENATVLNAALVDVAKEVARALRDALGRHALSAAAMFAQNDGTLMSLDQVVRFPVLTIGSGPSNSIRGAAHLTGVDAALVMDVGGTSTDVGALVGTLPRESSFGTEIGGVRTNFRMPDVVSVAVGGGSVLHDGRVGPQSVGYRLTSESLVFGGSTPTLTDAAVAAGRAAIGDRQPPPNAAFAGALRTADDAFADAVDRMKTGKGDQPLVVVGGGSVLVPDRLPGVSEIRRPDHHDVANAVGAAVALVGAQVERVVRGDARERRAEVERLCEDARARAVAAGADLDSVEVVAIEDVPLAYLTEPAARIRIRAAGPLRAKD